MAAKIIVVCNQKGGPGKTTTCLNVAGELSQRGYKVLVIDGDEQSSLVEIASLAPPDCPFQAAVIGLYKAGKKIHQEILKYVDSYDYIFVDCPPAAEAPLAQSALLVGDIAVVPFIPSPIDSMASTRIRDAIENARITNPDLKSCILLNRVQENWKVTARILSILKEFNMHVLESRLTTRAAYVESPFIGNSVHALKDRAEKIEPAMREINALTNEILGLLETDKETALQEQGETA
jgi:chromosome partitioning protein